MKTRLVQFYQDKVQSKIAALKAKVARIKQRAGEWLARHKRRLWITAAVIFTLVAIAGLAYLWQRSPAVRAMARGLAAVVTGCLAGLWALLRGNHPAEIVVPVIVTEQPPVEEEAFPVKPNPYDGRL